MKLMIKQKLTIFSALLVLVPFTLSALIIVAVVKSNIDSQSAQSVEKDARVAEQLYKNRELFIVQVVQNAAQTIAAQGLLDLAQAPQGASGATIRIQGEGSKRLNGLLKAAMQASNIDFIIVTDSRGNVIGSLSEASNEDSLKDNPLLVALQNGATANKLEAQSSSVRESAEALKVLAGEKFSQQAIVEGEGKKITEGLVIEAGAPITSNNNKLLGIVLAGSLINHAPQDKAIVEDIKNKLYPSLRDYAGISISVDDIIVSTNLPIQQDGGIGKKINGNLADAPKAGSESFNAEIYKTAYTPIKDINKKVIGRIGVQVKQSWFNAILYYVIGVIVCIVIFFLLVAIAVAIYSAQQFTRPIIELTQVANEISLGTLDKSIRVNSEDEIGKLADALERMRISLVQALEKLRAKRQQGK